MSEKTKQQMKKLHNFNRGKSLKKKKKRKVSEYHTGRKRPESTGNKISKALQGKSKSDTHRENMRVAALNRASDSEDTKRIKSESSKKRCENGYDMGIMRGKQYKKRKCEHCGNDISVNAIARHLKTCKVKEEE